MTTHTELLEIINNGESSGVEFKRDVLQNHDLAKEPVAFSNFAGGRVLLGVDDDGTIIGLTRPDLEQWVMTTCRDKIRPAIIPFFEIVRDVASGNDVAIVSVTRRERQRHLVRFGAPATLNLESGSHDQHNTRRISPRA